MYNLVESLLRNALSGSETIGSTKHAAIKNSNTESFPLLEGIGGLVSLNQTAIVI